MSGDRIFDVYEGRLGTPQTQADARERIQWLVDRIPGASNVLEVGCSQGLISILLARKGCEVDGIDLNAESIAQANGYLTYEEPEVSQRVRFIHADFLSIPTPKVPYDVIVMSEVLEHLSNPVEFLVAARSHLREDGWLCVQVPLGLHPHPDHYHHFYIAHLVQYLPDGYQIDTIDVVGMRLSVIAKLTKSDVEVGPDWYSWMCLEEKRFREKEERYLNKMQNLYARIKEIEKQKQRMEERLLKRDARIALLKEKLETEKMKVKNLRKQNRSVGRGDR